VNRRHSKHRRLGSIRIVGDRDINDEMMVVDPDDVPKLDRDHDKGRPWQTNQANRT
jgi:hypothetical protein